VLNRHHKHCDSNLKLCSVDLGASPFVILYIYGQFTLTYQDPKSCFAGGAKMSTTGTKFILLFICVYRFRLVYNTGVDIKPIFTPWPHRLFRSDSTECCCQVTGTSASYSEFPESMSRPKNRLFWLKISRFSSVYHDRCRGSNAN
jgi:hypothetical protein